MSDLYTLALSFLRGISQTQALQLLRHSSSAEQLFAGELPKELNPDFAHRFRTSLASYGKEALAQAEAELNYCLEKDIKVLTFGSSNYPTLLAECADAPLVLFYQGTASLNTLHSLSVVGTRKITTIGTDICRHLCKDLAQMCPDTLLVSGLAYGVDICIHREALANNLSTVAVLAHGLGQTCYPAAHQHTAQAMIHHGGLLTEYPHYVTPKREFFVRRNRIVAGLTTGTVVVESAKKGGALITAHLAQEYNRQVMAFPGRVFDLYSEGCNNLIREQIATLVTSVQDIIDLLNWKTPNVLPIQRELFPILSSDEQPICTHLATVDAATVNELALVLNLPAHSLLTHLFELELRGIIRRLAGGNYALIR